MTKISASDFQRIQSHFPENKVSLGFPGNKARNGARNGALHTEIREGESLSITFVPKIIIILKRITMIFMHIAMCMSVWDVCLSFVNKIILLKGIFAFKMVDDMSKSVFRLNFWIILGKRADGLKWVWIDALG